MPSHIVVSIIVIPIIVVSIVGLLGYLVYRYLILGISSRRAVLRTLKRYNIDKTPAQIIREYHSLQGQSLSDKEVHGLEKDYMRHEPDEFLAMYDAIREQPRNRSDDE